MEFIIGGCAFAIGIVIGYLLLKATMSNKREADTADIAELQRQLDQTKNSLEEKTATLNEAKVTIGELEARMAEREKAAQEMAQAKDKMHAEAIESQNARHKETMAQQDERHREAIDSLRRQFEETVKTMSEKLGNVTEEMLKQRQTEFAATSKEKIDQILAPLQTTIKEMKEAVAENTNKHSELGGRLNESLATLLNHTVAAQASADKLAGALKGSNQIQGEWGETVLRQLLESQGLQEGVHFHTQSVLQDAAGQRMINDAGNFMKPDVVMHLDKTRDVVIDSKVSLSAYFDYVNATDDDTRKAALDAHIRSIESHVNELVKKDYSSYMAEGKASLGYVIMFVPNTTALLLATTHKPEMWRKAMERKVYIADEQTLYAALKIISMTWQQIVQQSNHEQVYALAQEMLDRVASFMQKFMEIGSRLEAARKSYEAGMAKLQESGQSIPVTCRKLVKLGARPKKTNLKGVTPDLIGLDGDVSQPDELPS